MLLSLGGGTQDPSMVSCVQVYDCMILMNSLSFSLSLSKGCKLGLQMAGVKQMLNDVAGIL